MIPAQGLSKTLREKCFSLDWVTYITEGTIADTRRRQLEEGGNATQQPLLAEDHEQGKSQEPSAVKNPAFVDSQACPQANDSHKSSSQMQDFCCPHGDRKVSSVETDGEISACRRRLSKATTAMASSGVSRSANWVHLPAFCWLCSPPLHSCAWVT